MLTNFRFHPPEHPSIHRASKKVVFCVCIKIFFKSSTRQQKKALKNKNIESFFRIWKWLGKLSWCPQCRSNDFGANFSFNCKICSLMPFAKLFFFRNTIWTLSTNATRSWENWVSYAEWHSDFTAQLMLESFRAKSNSLNLLLKKICVYKFSHRTFCF